MKNLCNLGIFWSIALASLGPLSIPASAQFFGGPARKVIGGTTLPATCAVGDVFFKTDAAAGSNIYGCTGVNTWTVQAGGGGGASQYVDLTDVVVQGGGSPTNRWIGIWNSTLSQYEVRALDATDILGGTLLRVRGGTGQSTSPADNLLVGDGTNWNLKTLPSCSNATTSKLLYNSTTDTFSCGTDQDSGAGTGVAAVADLASLPATCTVGDLRSVTDQAITKRLYICSATNTWSRLSGISAGGLGALDCSTVDGECEIVTTVVPRYAAAGTWTALQTNDLGYSDVKQVAAPSNPSAGYNRVYQASSDGAMKCLKPDGSSCLASASIASTSSVLKGNGSGGAVAATAGTDYAAPVTAPAVARFTNFIPGLTVGTGSQVTSGTRLQLLFNPSYRTIDTCTVNVTTLSAGGTIYYGIYNSAGSPVCRASATTDATGVKTANCTEGTGQTMTPGYYWLAVAGSDGTMALSTVNTATATGGFINTGSGAIIATGATSVSGGNLPSSLGTVTAITAASTNSALMSCGQ
jgi:hypothetical protein